MIDEDGRRSEGWGRERRIGGRDWERIDKERTEDKGEEEGIEDRSEEGRV